MRGVNNSVETVNAAATAIVTAGSRVQQVTSPRRRWGGCFSIYWCFGIQRTQKHDKRINHAVLVPETTLPGPELVASENPIHQPALILPFTAPPSSPASFFQTEPPSAAQSPVAMFSLTSFSPNFYSPGGPSSIFTIGPYANDTQLVSPPVFSTFTTEPSTAPFTPPPEAIHLTTPSSPEVPFARLLTSSIDPNNKKGEAYEFQSYQLYPGSPIGHLISPSSACSGTSSPFPDLESSGSSFPAFPTGNPTKLLTAEGLAVWKLTPRYASRNGGSLLDGQISAVASAVDADDRIENSDSMMNRRVSFELTAEDVAHCLRKEEPAVSENAVSESHLDEITLATEVSQPQNEAVNISGSCVDETYHDLPEKLQASTSLGAGKEFIFDNTDGTVTEPTIGSEWWVNEKSTRPETGPSKNWAFFPIIQPGVS